MPTGLKRLTGRGDLHFVTFCCYQRRPLLGTAYARNLTVRILAEVRGRFEFVIAGYVIMPDHVHMLIGESRPISPAKIVQVFKQRVSRQVREEQRAGLPQTAATAPEPADLLRRFWQRRYYDFNVYSRAKLLEKLQYMHENPVNAGLVEHPGDWPWSSWYYYYRGHGLLTMDSWESLR
jgi:putative transposase